MGNTGGLSWTLCATCQITVTRLHEQLLRIGYALFYAATFDVIGLVFPASITFLSTLLIYLIHRYNKQVRRWLKNRLSKRAAASLSRAPDAAILLIWLANLTFQIIYTYSAQPLERVISTLAFIGSLVFLNSQGQLFFELAWSGVGLFVDVWSFATQRKLNKAKNSNSRVFQLSWKTLTAFALIGISFSAEMFVTRTTVVLIGVAILAIGLIYLILTATEIWYFLKSAAKFNWEAEKIYKSLRDGGGFLNKLKTSQYGPWVLGAFGLWKTIRPNDHISAVQWLKIKLDIIHFNSRLGLSLIRTFLFLRLLSSFLILSSLLVILEGNYLYAVGLASGTAASRAVDISNAFYIYTGNPATMAPGFVTPFLAMQMVAISALGWILLAVGFALTIEIFSAAYEPVEKLTGEIVDHVRSDIEAAVKEIENSEAPADLRPLVPLLVTVLENLKGDADQSVIERLRQTVVRRLKEISVNDSQKK